jgi:hypothetical protein
MDETPTTAPLDAPAEEAPAILRRSASRWWLRLLVILLVILAPLGYLISKQPPDLLPNVVATFTPPTPIPTATPIPLATILRARLLRLPTLSPGSACPVTPAYEVSPGIAEAAGDGPVYLVDPQETTFFPFTQSANPQGWAKQDSVVFLIRPGVGGDVLVRGHQVDGSNEGRFGEGDTPAAELIFKAPAQARIITDDDWSISFNTMRLREAGCYAIQIDSEATSSVIVFHAKPQYGWQQVSTQEPHCHRGAC